MKVYTFQLTDEECELVYWGLMTRVCVIETGTSTLRARDVVNMGKETAKSFGAEARVLDASQAAAVSLSDKLAAKLLMRGR